MTTVGIVIPNRDYARWLPDAVASVVRQSHEPLELWIVDDGSADDSVAVAHRLRRRFRERFRRFEVVELGTPGGKLRALNQVLREVSAEATVVLDADDALLPTYVQDTLALMGGDVKGPDGASLVYTDCWLVDALGRRLGRGRSTSFDGELLETCSFIPGCALVRTGALRAALPLDEGVRAGDKHHVWLRVCAAGATGVHLPRPLFTYRMHEANQSGIGRRILGQPRNGRPVSRLLGDEWPRYPADHAAVSAIDAS